MQVVASNGVEVQLITRSYVRTNYTVYIYIYIYTLVPEPVCQRRKTQARTESSIDFSSVNSRLLVRFFSAHVHVILI